MKITSNAFADGESIPAHHTCDGENVSPLLSWTDVPPQTKSLSLICEDPDAPGRIWVHWVLYGLPKGATGLPEALPKVETLPDGSHQGMTDFKKVGYGGPCPPSGEMHHYHFKLYALDTILTLPLKASKGNLLDAMHGHILAEAHLMGTYQRQGGMLLR